VGPEVSLRDASDGLKRQGARFRIFEYSEHDSSRPPKEVHVNGVIRRIEWTVHLVHRKPAALAGPAFDTVLPEWPYRNARLQDPGEREAQLVLDPGPVVLDGPGPVPVKVDDVPVTLGWLKSDPLGRLTVIGGDGSAWSPTNAPLLDIADNDGWFDGQADGVVSARLILANGNVETAEPAWVVVAPPRFAPGTRAPVSLYDVLYDQAVRLHGHRPLLFNPDSGAFDPT
jgi:hypothetical protein